MKNIKHSLHILLTFASMLGFLGGWATLAHSRKPAQPTTASGQAVESLPALVPLAPVDLSGAASPDSGSGGMTIIAPPLSARSSRPVFSTGGS